ncbi:hypothetical protein ASG42_28165 [Rhizobium sp. Leaf391]|nr:hypothetical protein ASG42_28165 [Rhizobium sp. Leaf391]
MLLCGFLVITFVISDPEYFLSLFDRDLTFTGRLPIWNFWLNLAHANWVWGRGFQASQQPEFAQLSRSYIFSAAGHPHNAFIEMYFNQGAAGLLVFIFLVLSIITKSLTRKKHESAIFNTGVAVIFSSCVMGMFDVGLFRFSKGTGFLIFILVVALCLRPRPPADVAR